MEEHGCRFEDKIIDMYGDIKQIRTDISWLAVEAKKRNGSLDVHVAESGEYRKRIEVNSSSMLWIKWVVGFLMVLSFAILRTHLEK